MASEQVPFWRAALGALGLTEAARAMAGVGPAQAEAEKVIADEEARGFGVSPILAAELRRVGAAKDAVREGRCQTGLKERAW